MSPPPFCVRRHTLVRSLRLTTVRPLLLAACIHDASYTVAGGGLNNTVRSTAEYGTIGGGKDNAASGQQATVAGGASNWAQADFTTVSGGYDNTAAEAGSMILGGYENFAGAHGTTVGGTRNTAAGLYSIVAGGRYNLAGYAATASGGERNLAQAPYVSLKMGEGGQCERESARVRVCVMLTVVSQLVSSSVPIARSLRLPCVLLPTSRWAVLAGGWNNTIDTAANGGTISGGSDHVANGQQSVIAGGHNNAANGFGSTVSGGRDNRAVAKLSLIAGGEGNAALGLASVVAGLHNMAEKAYSIVAGGRDNMAGYAAVVSGGVDNTANASYVRSAWVGRSPRSLHRVCSAELLTQHPRLFRNACAAAGPRPSLEVGTARSSTAALAGPSAVVCTTLSTDSTPRFREGRATRLAVFSRPSAAGV